MTNQEAHEQLILWLGTLLGITVIKDLQQATRPAVPYGMVDLANWQELSEHPDRENFEELDTVNSEGFNEVKMSPAIEVEWTFLFMVYGAGGGELVRKLQSLSHIKSAQSALMQEGLTVHAISSANDIPELIDEKWEPRTQVNIVVRGVSDTDGVVIDTIEEHSVTITGERA